MNKTTAWFIAIGFGFAFYAAQPARAGTPPAAEVDVFGTLCVGDSAPRLSISSWLKGEPVPAFQPGSIYILEFWATWCGPCIEAMPHLTEIQKKYESADVHVIGVTTPDARSNTIDAIKKLVNAKGDAIGYRMGMDENGTMNRTYLLASAMPVIPATYIVDRNGILAWVGSPSTMDKPLAQILDGTWDIADARGEFKKNQAYGIALLGLDGALKKKDAAAIERHSKVIVELGGDSVVSMAILASSIVDPAANLDFKANPKLASIAVDAASKANTASGGKDPDILSLLARSHFASGDGTNAKKIMSEAIQLQADPTKRAALEKQLAAFSKD